MVTMQFLRMLADAAFFYMIAATVAVGYGAGSPFLALSIQSLCFALSRQPAAAPGGGLCAVAGLAGRLCPEP